MRDVEAVLGMQRSTVQLKISYADMADGTCRAWRHVISLPFLEHQ
jgi:hypothetical protein